MSKWRAALGRFRDDEAGATALEYAFVAGLVSLSVLAGATRIGAWAGRTYGAMASSFGP